MTTNSYRHDDTQFLLDEALKALEEADLALAFAKGVVDQPFRPEDVTQPFMQSVFEDRAPGAKLLEMQDVGGHEGMAARRRFTLKWDATGERAGLPDVVFVKGIREIPYHLESIASKHFHVHEERFFNLVRPELPDIAPIAYYARAYVGGRYMLVMEDLAARGADPKWMHYDCSLEYAREAMKTLAILHSKYWESDRFHGDLAWCRPRSARYGKFWFRNLFINRRQAWLDGETGQKMPDELRDLLQKWNKYELEFYRYRDQNRPQTLCHGDTHLGNTYEYPDGRAGLLDWQIIHRGLGIAEAAHFVMSAFTDAERKKYDKELFELYLDQMEQGGVKMDREQSWDDWCLSIFYIWDCTLTSIQVGTFGHQMNAFWRRWDTTSKAMLDYGVSDRLDSVVRRMNA